MRTFFFFSGSNCRMWKFTGQGLIQAIFAIYTAAVATLDPLTHCNGLEIEPTPLQGPEPAAVGFLTQSATVGTLGTS